MSRTAGATEAVGVPASIRPAPQAGARAKIAAFIRLSRLRFLLESLLLVTAGTMAASFVGHPLSWGGYLMAQAVAWGIHLMVHYCNEYFDLEADVAQLSPTQWTGGSRVLAGGELRPVVSLAAAFISLFVVLGLVIALSSGVERVIALAAVALAWFYTAPPLRLNYVGMGEITTAMVLNVLWPALAFHLQAKQFEPLLLAVVLPPFLLMTARMMVMNFCDSEADLSVGKRTLPNLLGPRRAAVTYTALQIIAYGLIVAFFATGVLPWPAAVLMLATAVLGGRLAVGLFRDPPSAQPPERAGITARRATTHIHMVTFAGTVGLLVAALLPDAEADGAGVILGGALTVGYLVLFAAQRLHLRRATPTTPEEEPA